MTEFEITLFVESKRISTSSADFDSLGHQCANPMRTGAYDRMGSEGIVLDQKQGILLDAAIRACNRMKWNLVIEDVSKWGLLKKLRWKGAVPRLVGNGRIMTVNPTSPSSNEIIRFFTDEPLEITSADE